MAGIFTWYPKSAQECELERLDRELWNRACRELFPGTPDCTTLPSDDTLKVKDRQITLYWQSREGVE